MMHISDVKQTDIIDAFNTTSRYLDNILSINNIFSGNMGKSNMPFRELLCNKTYTSDAKNKEKGNDQESIQSNTTTDPGHHIGK